MDLYTHVEIPLSKAILGGQITFPHWEEDYIVNIPAGTQHGDKIRVSNAGIKKQIFTGDLYLTALIPIPKKLTKEQRELMELYSKVEDVNPSFVNKIKERWANFSKKKFKF